MARLQHTPGPWTYNPKSANRVMGPKGEIVAATYGGFVGSDEQAANTRLVASTPVLYEFVAGKAEEGDADALAIIAAMEPSES